MYSILKKMYAADKLTETGLDNAIAKGWITEAEKEEIMNSYKF
jgi:hypothetical protein